MDRGPLYCNTTPDPNIEITSDKEDTFEPTEDNHMDIARMSKPTKIEAGLLEDFSRKNDDAIWWLLAMKAYFGMNDEIYKDDKTIILVFLKKWVKEIICCINLHFTWRMKWQLEKLH